MTRFDWEPRKELKFLPAIGWTMFIDAMDIFSPALDAIGTIAGVGIGGLAANTGFDVFQMLGMYAVFDEPLMTVANVDLVLPPGFDLLPSYTALYIADHLGFLGE